MTKIIALYLPQFHEIEENNEIWGEGFTEWHNVKSALRYKKFQNQPRIPLNGNYYDLSKEETLVQQCNLAAKYGVYGFCFYHYWFCGHLVMPKPMENFLNNKNSSLKYCISWANHSWFNSPSKIKKRAVIKQEYGGKEDWIRHFEYLLKFFQDSRYIKVDGKPMMVIHNAKDIGCWLEMRDIWNDLAKQNGFSGIHFVSTLNSRIDNKKAIELKFDARAEFQPSYTLNYSKYSIVTILWKLKRLLYRDVLKKVSVFSYRKVWKKILKLNQKDTPEIITYLGAYSDWDNTPRWKNLGNFHRGATPELFGFYLEKQIEKSKRFHKSEFLFLNAWNEWGEGAYIEPDEQNGFGYLKQIHRLSKKKTDQEARQI